MRSSLAIPTGFFLLLPLTALAEGNAEAVRGVFSAYKSAILAGEGADAAALLSTSTYTYYDDMRQLALFGEAEKVQAQSLVNQMQVLLLRLRVPPERLESFSPPALIAYAVDQGWIGKNSVLRLQPGNVVSEGDVAALHVIVDGTVAGPAFRFNRESGQWRIDLVPTMQASNAALQLAAQRQGVSESDFMLVLLESTLGHKIGSEAWRPLKSAPGD